MASSRVAPLPSPIYHRNPPRSRSPNRPIPDYEHTDPLLGSLSPESTLQALTSTNAVPKNERVAHDILSRSIAQVSPAERALAIRAAVVAQKLNRWYKEIQSWNWPKQTGDEKGLGFIPPSDATDEEYYGSLPAAVVEEHEKRIEEIRDEMDVLDMDELKEHVLNAHIPARSRPSSANSSLSVPPQLSYVQLSDFTAVITATILRALPLLSRLMTLLSIWDVRLLVLRQIPVLLRSLRLARSELEAALDLLKSSDPPGEKDPLFSRSNYHAKRSQLEATVVSAGRRLDCVLDALDECEDSIPDSWIDDLEGIESEFGSWTMQAEQRTVENEWQRMTFLSKTSVNLDIENDVSKQLSSDSSRDEDHSHNSSAPVVQTSHTFPMETLDEEELYTPVEAAPPYQATNCQEDTSLPSDIEAAPSSLDRTASPALSEATNIPAELVSSNATPNVSQTSIDSTSRPLRPTIEPDMPSAAEEIGHPCPAHKSPCLTFPEDSLQPPSSPQTDTGSVIIRRPNDLSMSPHVQRVNSPRIEEDSSPYTTNLKTYDQNCENLPPSSDLDEKPASTNQIGQNDLAEVPTTKPPSRTNSIPAFSSDSPGTSAKSVVASSDEELPLRTSSLKLKEATDDPTPKKPLESPIKLSKTRPGPLIFETEHADSRHRRRSIASSISDYPSLVSSPERRGPHESSSNGTPLLLETPPPFQAGYQSSDPVAPGSDHTLREDRLFRLDSQKASPHTDFAHNRNLSLPLQRFINERLELTFGDESSREPEGTATTDRPKELFPSLHSGPKKSSSTPQAAASSTSTKNARQHSNTMRLKRQLTSHPSLESIGAYRSEARSNDDASSIPAFLKTASRASTPTPQMRKPKDHLDEKISSILTALDAQIHLVSADAHEHDGHSTSSYPLKQRERFRSVSPQGSPARSGTPTPSLTITPAVSRRRYSHAHAPEESSVKLYHLHRGGKSAPTKLFVRSVGENGERVMVRVGGGWADLAEYLREFAVHHGRRHVSDTPLVEVQGLSRTSPPSPPRNRLAPTASGRRTPSRPPSVLSNRPGSSLAVRKTRRTSNVSDMTEFRSSNPGDVLSTSYSPMSTVSSRRRLSTSSNASMGASSASEFRHGSSYSPTNTAAGSVNHTVPLGLAGPRPRHVSISAESEAWVEDVLGQARRSSSLRPYTYGLAPQEPEPAPEKAPPPPVISKSRSISDLGTVGSSRRIALRGLGRR
ncbi:hypothetical protein BO99DRAFT_325362 [Aspergillus violaceofuscus CBS 115571]|uniref:GAR domain-containing protein n=1 Tax=Aspergillus violaceofuscus (strain CBS 115571) TaxID=1450538 RepID=A0A2V5HE72_ASPV1|nr:hypothetical protein BO99DRAFT_325362 [Aspergillus violaceofuscus CBS 115571]